MLLVFIDLNGVKILVFDLLTLFDFDLFVLADKISIVFDFFLFILFSLSEVYDEFRGLSFYLALLNIDVNYLLTPRLSFSGVSS